MVRLTSLLRFRATPALKWHEFAPEMHRRPSIKTAVPGLTRETFSHNWSLAPLFVCSIVGGIAAFRYVYRLIRPFSNTENYQEPMVFCLKPYKFGETWTPMSPKIGKDKKSATKK